MSQSPWSHHRRSSSVSDDVDFEVKGEELQFVEIELDPGESAVAEAGSMVWKDASVGMTTVFGDGSASQGFMGKLLGGTGWLQRKVQAQAGAGLRKFQAARQKI